jgi:hypothetical protein
MAPENGGSADAHACAYLHLEANERTAGKDKLVS